VTLDDFEQDIEKHVEAHLDIENQQNEIEMLLGAAKEHSKKRKSITLRVHEMDLEAMRLKASKAGVPYQTYINMLIHKDASQL